MSSTVTETSYSNNDTTTTSTTNESEDKLKKRGCRLIGTSLTTKAGFKTRKIKCINEITLDYSKQTKRNTTYCSKFFKQFNFYKMGRV
jgi:hypothetical protein